jgi:hypothetical protein
MGSLPDRAKLLDLMIPGSHDAATSYLAARDNADNSNSINPEDLAVTQDKKATIKAQLENGIRYFDFRFRKERGGDAAFYQLYHTYFLHTNMAETLNEIRDFLDRHPKEVVFVQIQPNGGEGDDYAIVGAQEIRDAIYSPYRQVAHLEKSLPAAVSAIPGYKGTATNLFVEGYQDFDDIRLLRKYRGLGGLGVSEFYLARPNFVYMYSDDTPIPDPKATPNVNVRPKLNYDGLALGDVRGRVILVGSGLIGFPGHGFSDRDLNVVLLGPSEFSSGETRQDNYAPSSLSEKLNSIKNFALAEYGSQLPLNFTSAAPNSSVVKPGAPTSPSWWARRINSGEASAAYKDNGNDTLASWLNIHKLDGNAPNGDLAKYNFSEKIKDKVGLNGVMLGDFYTTPNSYYSDYKESFVKPSLHDDQYQPSDWLTQKIWRQSALVTPEVIAKTDPIVNGGSVVSGTGLPKVLEGGSFSILWSDYFGRESEGQGSINRYRAVQVSYADLGLDPTSHRIMGDSATTSFKRKVGGRSGFSFKGVNSAENEKSFYSYSPSEFDSFTVLPQEGVQGDRFFKIEAVNGSQGIGTPVYFMVSDSV